MIRKIRVLKKEDRLPRLAQSHIVYVNKLIEEGQLLMFNNIG